jgi:hypothetical protein
MSSVVSIAIIIILSLISSAWKKKNQENSSPSAEDTDLEEELRRMAERMMGKKEKEAPSETTTPPVVETFRSLRDEHRESKSSPYETFDNDEGDVKYEKYNRIPDTTAVDYSERDIKRVAQQQETYKTPTYISYTENYDQRTLESFKKGKELHTVMNTENEKVQLHDEVEKHIMFEDFDPRKAIIYAEIMKRPEY